MARTIRVITSALTVRLVFTAAVVLFGLPIAAWAQVAPPLGQAARFGVLGNSAVTGATGAGVSVTGDVGSSPTATISNFPPSTTVPPHLVHYTNDGVVQQAHTDTVAAYAALQAQGPGTVLADDLATVGALTPGIYSFATGAPNLPAGTTLTLNGAGVFVFNVGSALTANVLSNVVGTANPCNIFWRIGSSATLNGTNFRGTVIASASITVGAGANLAGRALAGAGATGAVTMAGAGGNTIGGCSTPPPVCPAITVAPSTLPNGTVATVYTQTITASGGTAPYTYAVSAGTVPPGLSLQPGGVLSGTPTSAGASSFTVRASDAVGCSAERPYTLTIVPAVLVCPAISLLPTAAANGRVGTFYTQTFTASGGTAPYTFTVPASTLPPGLTLTAGGVLSGTPTLKNPQTFVIRVTDALGCFAQRQYTVTIVGPDEEIPPIIPPVPPVCPTITLSPATLPIGTLGVAYSQTLTGSGGTGPYIFTVSSGGTLPTGLTLTTAGVLQGTPLDTIPQTFTIRGSDSLGCFAERPLAFSFIPTVPTLPQVFALMLALSLGLFGYQRLRAKGPVLRNH